MPQGSGVGATGTVTGEAAVAAVVAAEPPNDGVSEPESDPVPLAIAGRRFSAAPTDGLQDLVCEDNPGGESV